MTSTDRLAEMDAEIERLRARIVMLEAQRQGDELMAAAMRRGTPAKPTPDEPATITHDIPPNAPR